MARGRDGWLILIGVMLAVLFMPGCATPATRQVVACDSRPIWIQSKVSPVPALTCAEEWANRGADAWMIAQVLATLPLACVVPVNRDAFVVVLPPLDPGGMILAHEEQHARSGKVHSALVSVFEHGECEP